MKYLKKYRLFESLQSYQDTIHLVNNALALLGFSLEYTEYSADYPTKFIVKLNADITKHPSSILFNILYVMNEPKYGMSLYQADICPVIIHHSSGINYTHTESEIKLLFNTKPTYDEYNDENLSKNRILIPVNTDNFYHKLIQQIIYVFELSSGEFNFNSTTHLPDGPDIKKYPFLKTLIIEYLNYLYKLNNVSNFDINILYKITCDNITKSHDPYTIFYELKEHDEKLYKEITQFQKPEDLKKSNNLKDMGF